MVSVVYDMIPQTRIWSKNRASNIFIIDALLIEKKSIVSSEHNIYEAKWAYFLSSKEQYVFIKKNNRTKALPCEEDFPPLAESINFAYLFLHY